jgi:choline dehydrogenase-like flavoprotein
VTEDGRQISGERRLRADAVVIGSGAGGAPVAAALARAGARGVVLEDGAEHATESLTARPRDMLPRLYRDAGQTTTIGNPPIVLPLGRAVGGTTLVNSGTCFRTPDAVLARWRDELDLDVEGMDAYFDRVEETIGVSEVPPELAGHNARLAKRGADAIGWSGGYLRRNARGCVGSGVCAFGCPRGAKQHAGITYVTAALEAGATLVTGVRVRRIEHAGGRATGVSATTAGGGTLHVDADTVVLSAGTIHTPGLLGASGLGHESGDLGRHLSIHPATAVWALFEEEVHLAQGVPQSYCVDEFADRGVMLETVGGPPDYVAMAMPFAGDRQRELMLRYRHLAQFGLMVSDRSRGRVHSRFGRPLIRYDLGAEDVAAIAFGLERLVELWWAAGAEQVLLPVVTRKVPDPFLVRGARPDLSGLRASELKLMAFHPLGTARMDGRPGRGVVDAEQRVKGTANVFVSDGSVVPTALGVNPQITILALAERLGERLGKEAHVLSR